MKSQPSARSNVGLALAVLEEVARMGPKLSAREIARTLGMPRTSAYRLINSLTAEEYLVRHPESDGFLLGARVVELAHLIAPTEQLSSPDILADVRERTDKAVHFVRFSGGRIVVVDEDPRLPLASVNRLRRMLGASAIGHLLLAAFPPPSPHGGAPDAPTALVVQTAHEGGITRSEHRLIAQGVARTGYAGYADVGGTGRACVAVPVRARSGRIVGGLALAHPDGRLDAATSHLLTLREAGDRLAAAEAHRVRTGEITMP